MKLGHELIHSWSLELIIFLVSYHSTLHSLSCWKPKVDKYGERQTYREIDFITLHSGSSSIWVYFVAVSIRAVKIDLGVQFVHWLLAGPKNWVLQDRLRCIAYIWRENVSSVLNTKHVRRFTGWLLSTPTPDSKRNVDVFEDMTYIY